MKLSILIPCYNEVSTIEKIITKINSQTLIIDKEIILIDDCSTDGTKLKLIFLTLLPIYYGLFISFATFEEFSRLMLVISPVQIINFFIFIFLILRKKNNLFNK